MSGFNSQSPPTYPMTQSQMVGNKPNGRSQWQPDRPRDTYPESSTYSGNPSRYPNKFSFKKRPASQQRPRLPLRTPS